uniref:Uncharacterized protein n=1 Tax=Parascaris equorum TaxID=6256 RepID=A0A914S6Q9_PAREQ
MPACCEILLTAFSNYVSAVLVLMYNHEFKEQLV